MEGLIREELFDFHGVPMINSFTNNWENIQKFKARQDDILIATYPKAGTTWVSYILELLYFGDSSERQKTVPIHDRVPFLELSYLGFEPGVIEPTSQHFHQPLYEDKSIRMSFDSEKMQAPTRAELFDFHGVAMTKVLTDNWENIQNFKARPDDILIATYPKAGTTWVSYILELLYFDDSSEHQKTVPIHDRVPFLEMANPGMDPGTVKVEKLPTFPRLIKTHYPVKFVPKSFWEQNCKVCSLLSMWPEMPDNAVSFYHFNRMTLTNPEPGDWNSYIHRFMEGKRKVGDWKNHFTVAQNEEFDEDYKRRMKDPTLKFRTTV